MSPAGSGVGSSLIDWQQFLSLRGAGAHEGLTADLFLTGGEAAWFEGIIYPTELASCDFASLQ